jgi:hypothetical protein
MVTTWPQLAQGVNSNAAPSYLLFNTDASTIVGRKKNGGMIENRVDRVMRKLPMDRRRYVKRRKVAIESSANIVEIVSTFKKNLLTVFMQQFFWPFLQIPVQSTTSSRKQMMEQLRATLETRNKLRTSGKTATEILKYFPNLLAFNGDMVSVDCCLSVLNLELNSIYLHLSDSSLRKRQIHYIIPLRIQNMLL